MSHSMLTNFGARSPTWLPWSAHISWNWPPACAMQTVADALHHWMRQQRQKTPDGSAIAQAIDYSLNRWVALTR